ncbi:septal ring lytic transglycosylase RlpA family protein [Massilia sp. W12]|uniref:septal ring lytic transglycosylase RlpA family protein n=1 Tax=Massilia sp. W12 TaxID=3126507 RepID=UPI0030CE747F
MRNPSRPGLLAAAVLCAYLSACSTSSQRLPAPETKPRAPAADPVKAERPLPQLPPANSGRGGYYQDDGPGDNPPPGLYELPDAEPVIEAPSRTGNKPYKVFGRTYTPISDDRPYVQRGVGSWYGRKFHGQRTSSGEPYDMYKMTAAHPLLPIPSYARVTNLVNGKQVVVRVNDRGPFHANRVIDLSYTAALKLGLLGKGSHEVEIERILPEEIARQQERKKNGQTNAALAVAGATGERLLRMRDEDARIIRELDREWRSQVLPPPVAAADSESAIKPELALLRIEHNLEPGAAAQQHNGSGFYLQLGAFSQADNAEAERAKIARDALLPGLAVIQSGKMYRLFSGPFASRELAMQAAQAGNLRALVVQR